MTEPTENEQVDEELSVDDLKSVSGDLSKLNQFGV